MRKEFSTKGTEFHGGREVCVVSIPPCPRLLFLRDFTRSFTEEERGREVCVIPALSCCSARFVVFFRIRRQDFGSSH
jgi:hypothetical protein